MERANARHALISESDNSGNAFITSARSCSSRCWRTRSTGMRVPRTTGLPAMTAGSLTIRSR